MPANEPPFQNLWGVTYGGLILAGFNNQVTALVLNEISGNDGDLKNVGLAFSYLGSNASTVFGDANENAGLAKLMAAQVSALQDKNITYQGNEILLQAYARALSQTIYADTLAFIKLAKAIPAAFS